MRIKVDVLSEELINTSYKLMSETLENNKSIKNIIKTLNNIYKKAEWLIKEEIQNQSVKLECKEGCSYCCHNTVAITPVEVFPILDYLSKKLNDSEKEKIHEKIKFTFEKIKKLNNLERKNAQIPCPFLEDNKCSIYEFRPLACRGWNSINLESCKSAFYSDRDYKIRAFSGNLIITNSISLGISNALAKHNLRNETLDLIKTLKVALSREEKTEKRFLSGKQAFISAILTNI